MSRTFQPETEEQLADIVAQALADNETLDVRGRGSKQTLGCPTKTNHVLDLAKFSGIVFYEPEELVIQVRAGTPMAEIEAVLAENKQEFAFEPCDLGPLLGGQSGQGSIGGALACNLSGPRRIKAGAARDHFLGVSAYSGRGELFKAGGRVVKNVTGYDLCKLLANSYGTLCVMTTVTLKVLPAAEKSRTILVRGLDETQGIAALTKALASSHEVSAAAYLPQAVAARSDVAYVRDAAASVTAVRVEGPVESAAHRCMALRQLLGASEELHSHNSLTFWRELRDVKPFVNDPRTVWRISVAPQAGPQVGKALRALGAEYFYDWGGGLLWAAMPDLVDAGAGVVRGAVAAAGGGHAMLVRAPANIREKVAVFQPQNEAVAALTRRIKIAFDPNRIFNPGRIAAGL
jgi:glycolate oxidase FAD binding subunit